MRLPLLLSHSRSCSRRTRGRCWQVHPLLFALFLGPMVLGLLPKLNVVMLLLTRGIDEEQLEEPSALTKSERLRRNLMALNIMAPAQRAPLDLDHLPHASRSAPSSPRGPLLPRRTGANLIQRHPFDGDRHKFFASSKFAGGHVSSFPPY